MGKVKSFSGGFMGVYDINYLVTSDLMMICHFIYEEKMKSVLWG
jgi:hypothetical protein